jgi:hypothetical protein
MITINCKSKSIEQLLINDLKKNKGLDVKLVEAVIAVIAEAQVNNDLIKKILAACQELDDPTKAALSDALKYTMTHANDDDFVKTYGTVTSNVLLGTTD